MASKLAKKSCYHLLLLAVQVGRWVQVCKKQSVQLLFFPVFAGGHLTLQSTRKKGCQDLFLKVQWLSLICNVYKVWWWRALFRVIAGVIRLNIFNNNEYEWIG